MTAGRDNEATSGPLAGLRVLDLTRFIAGPFCTQLLANLGADVVKVEKEGKGDEARDLTPRAGTQALYLMWYNSNKRSIEVDFRSQEGQDLVLALAEQADVIVENFRAGTLERMGLAPDVLLARNPKLVITRVSGFGQDGPWVDRNCFDAIAQAESGLMSITGRPDGPPTVSGTFVVDHSAALHAAVATLAAVIEAKQSGKGQVVDVALLDSGFSLLMSGPLEKIFLDKEMTRIGNDDRYAAPGGTFPCSDGWVHFVAGSPVMFPRILAAMNRLDLADDPRFATVASRMENRAAINVPVEQWTRAYTAAEVVAIFQEHGIPTGRVATIPEALENPQLKHRQVITYAEHTELGSVPVGNVVPKLSRTPGSIRYASPLLGEHTDEVLAEWLPERPK